MSLKRTIQLVFAKWLKDPEIPEGKTSGYSLVRSEKSDCQFCAGAYAVAPYLLQNVHLGDNSYFAMNAHAANVSIGKFCSIGPNFCCGLGIHPTNGISTSPILYSDTVDEHKQTTIGNDVFIGANVTILDGVHIGNGAVIGTGAVVTKDIPAYAIAVGVPARVIKYRFEKETIDRLLEMKWWDWPEEELKKVNSHFWDVNGFIK